MGYTKEEIVLRTTTHSPLTVTGVPKTWIEEDNNWIILYEFMKAFVTAVAPYNPATTYPGSTSTYVSYADNIWLMISATDQTAVTPGTDPAVWQLTSAGAMGHAQGTDLSIGLGSAYHSTAVDIWSVINEQVISITTALFITYRNGGFFKPNRIYKINDISDGDFYIRALTSSRFDPRALVLHRSADYINYTLWDAVGTYAVNDIAIWNNAPYKNLTGANAGTPDTDGTNWVLLVTGAGFYFRWMEITIDQDLNPHGALSDDQGNSFPYAWFSFVPLGHTQFTDNKCDASSYLSTPNILNVGNVTQNNLNNNSSFSINGVIGDSVINNTLRKSILNLIGNCSGSIINNDFLNCNIEFTAGFSNQMMRCSFNFPKRLDGLIVDINDANDYIAETVTPDGSTITRNGMDISGSAPKLSIDSDYATNYQGIIGTIIALSSNPSETISQIECKQTFLGKIIPVAGFELRVQTVTISSASDNEIVSDLAVGTYVLLGDNGDYLEVVQHINMSGNIIHKVKFFIAS